MNKSFPQLWLEFLARFSLRNQYRVGGLIAIILRFVPNQVSRLIRENIQLCFSDLDEAGRKRLYRDSIRHACYAMTELAAAWCWPMERLRPLITSVEVCPEFENSNKGKVVLAPHLGCWEILALWLGENTQAMFMYKRRKNRRFDQFINQARGRTGGEPVPTKKHGLRKLLVGLKQNQCLMILPDQRPGGKKAFIDSTFFGHNAPTTTLVQNLCSKVECDVFIATIYRSDPIGEFGLRVLPLDYERLAGEKGASAAYMNDAIEQLVRQYPEQYLWGYRRFKSTAYQSLQASP